MIAGSAMGVELAWLKPGAVSAISSDIFDQSF
jgi:hypothetical protein